MPTVPSYLNQEDTPVDSSNGDVDPTATDVHRKLQTIGTGSCPDVCFPFNPCSSCTRVTSNSVIGANSCTDFESCRILNGRYTCILSAVYYMSTQLTVCNSSLFHR